ncbi:MAG: chemotaxis protein CheA [Planctomycetota bacterium]
MAFDDDELLVEFLAESRENLNQISEDLVAMETSGSADRIANIFRMVHTLKGTAGFMAFSQLESVTHEGEHILAQLRDGSLEMSRDINDGLFAMVDAVRELLIAIETDGTEGNGSFDELIGRLETLAGDGQPKDSSAENSVASPAVPDQDDDKSETNPVASEDHPGQTSETTVRLDVEVLDKLMNQVGELVLARNQILEYCNQSESPQLLEAAQRLNQITSELQTGVLKTRMRPIRNAWNSVPRVVRDLSNMLGKRVQVILDGADTELDKSIIEAIRDPLTHIVRNAVDHGIELPDERIALGKPDTARLQLRASHQAGMVKIEVSDDGSGISLDRVREKAIANGLVLRDKAAAMSEREIINLILTPGFSTASQVTNVSGRGVGMDVVKTNVEQLGGTLEIDSRRNEGTTIRLKIPLTLAIVPAIIVSSCGERFAIPQVSL